jgi:hypothetical protein
LETATKPSRFDVVVRSRAWEWLDALNRRLQIEVQLVDAQGYSRTPATTAAQTPLARLVASGADDVRAVATTAATRRARHTATFGDLKVVAQPLVEGDEVIGAILVGCAASARRAAAPQNPSDLDVLIESVLQAVQAHVAAPTTGRAQVDDLGSLANVLDGAAATGTDRELVSAFAAALAFWKRIDVYGYVSTSNNIFVADVLPPVAAEPRIAATIPASALPASNSPTALSRAQIEALGIRDAGDVVVARVAEGDHPWLLVFCGAIPSSEVVRLGVYVRLLDQLIRTVTSEVTVRLVTTISAHLIESGESAEATATAVLDALNAGIGMSSGTLTLTTGYGAPLLKAGQLDIARPSDVMTATRLATLRRVPGRYTLNITLTAAEGRRITSFQRNVAEAVTNVIDAWIRRALPELQRRDRRAGSRAFDQVLERFAGEALDSGSTVSVIVLLAGETASFPGLTQQWIARLRAVMRASDIVGMLDDGEIGLLLHDTTRERAETVAQRLLRLLLADAAYGSPIVALGIATRTPNGSGSAGISEEARNDAIARARSSQNADMRGPSDDSSR